MATVSTDRPIYSRIYGHDVDTPEKKARERVKKDARELKTTCVNDK